MLLNESFDKLSKVYEKNVDDNINIPSSYPPGNIVVRPVAKPVKIDTIKNKL